MDLARPTHRAANEGAWGARLAAIVIVALVSIPAARSQPSKSTSDLDRLRDEIGRLKAKLDDVHRQAKSAQQELEAVDLELGIRTRELDLAIETQNRLDGERKTLEVQIAELTPRIDRQKKFLGKRLAALYRMGELSYLRMLLSMDDRRDPIEAMSMLSFLITRDARAVSRFQATSEQLALRKADLADRQRKIADVRRVVEDRQRAVAAAHAEKEQLVASLQRQEHGSEKHLEELEEKARRLERLIEVLSKHETAGAGSFDVRTVQGALPWPADGKVVERFGRQRNPKFDTFTTNNGIKIETPTGAPVRAVFSGTVLFSQWFKGYGNLIILDHGHRVFSLYGNLKSASVAAGDRIAAGQTIAGTAESEETPPAYLYFEIRQDNRPEDPQKWLR
ncbi:MAG TPA: peptidoglycan DD-metalloendopeptidase family protein [Thermoanaerobaculia bacterium]|jgi:septal ring factor EnvC (AmiA/AmiB activator)|nr:peptidoglycan DD-metalloendopeptidase family protein [Thermoanaerobaculia bacterium]